MVRDGGRPVEPATGFSFIGLARAGREACHGVTRLTATSIAARGLRVWADFMRGMGDALGDVGRQCGHAGLSEPAATIGAGYWRTAPLQSRLVPSHGRNNKA
ncbi:hypothetical protein [Lysobacter gummosus]|uniref:hypothetical protein n=1 Tax=Lysobacter gummosus TaxID=262324 RepID=UPI0036250764